MILRLKEFGITSSAWGEQVSSVSIVSGCRLDDRVIVFRFAAEAKGFFI
jgi:hypothetical protein